MIKNMDKVIEEIRNDIENDMRIRLSKLKRQLLKENNGNTKRKIAGEISFIELCLNIKYLILGNYNGNKAKIELMCYKRNHFIDTMHPNSLKSGNRCKKCYELDRKEINRNSESAKKAKEEFYELADGLGYKVIGGYSNNKTRIEMECPEGHITNTLTPNSFKRGNRCYKCWPNNPEKAKEEFYKLAEKEGYEILEEYTNSRENVKMKCPKGHEIDTLTPNGFKTGNRCIQCYIDNRVEINRNNRAAKKAKEEFYVLANLKRYIVKGEYITTSTPIKMECPKGHETDTLTPSSFRKGHECKVCYDENRSDIFRNTDKNLSAKKEFEMLAEFEGYEMLGAYNGANTSIAMKCDRGHITDTLTPSHFKSGVRCLECYEEDRTEIIRNNKTAKETREKFYQLVEQEGYEILSDYTIGSDSIDMKCNKGHIIFTLSPSRFISGNRCYICHNENRRELAMNTERSITAREEFYKLAEQEGYEVLGEYLGTKEPIAMKCPKGHETNTNTPGHFRNGIRCSECTNKYGELKCKSILDFYNISYNREQKFDGLVGLKDKPLRFDFYLPDFNTCIEIQGEWHFEDEGIYSSSSTKEHDKIKRQWCKDNGKKLLEIEYLTVGKGKSKLKAFDHIENELNKYLKNIGAI